MRAGSNLYPSQLPELWWNTTLPYPNAMSAFRHGLLGLLLVWLPLQGAETLKFYNGMLIGVYELLAAQQGQALAARQYIEASKAFWLTWVDLERAVGTSLATGRSIATSRITR